MSIAQKYQLSEQEIDRIIEMAWEDRTPFEAIFFQFGIPEKDVIGLMRETMKASSWRMWRARMQGRKTKHLHKRSDAIERFRCKLQKSISHNKISKR